jgi:hypothetical protein
MEVKSPMQRAIVMAALEARERAILPKASADNPFFDQHAADEVEEIRSMCFAIRQEDHVDAVMAEVAADAEPDFLMVDVVSPPVVQALIDFAYERHEADGNDANMTGRLKQASRLLDNIEAMAEVIDDALLKELQTMNDQVDFGLALVEG